MAGIYDLSRTAGSNTSLINIGTIAAPGDVDDAIRNLASYLAKYRDDIGGAATTGGSANAHTLTTYSGLLSGTLADGVLVGFTAGFTNTGAVTLNPDTLGAKDLKKYTAAGLVALAAGDIQTGGKYLAAYEATGEDFILLNPSTASAAPTAQAFTSSGTWTKPAGISGVIVEVWGAGGGSGGIAATAAAQAGASGGGGGGGYSVKRIATASLGATETVTIGAAGAAAGAGNNDGGTGGTSSFGSHATATGGSGGAGSAAGASAYNVGGSGGAGASGDLNLTGQAGGAGVVISGPVGFPAFGGSGARGGAGGKEATTTTAGTVPGGGGGGSFSSPSTAARTGWAGGAGMVVVWEFYA